MLLGVWMGRISVLHLFVYNFYKYIIVGGREVLAISRLVSC